MSSEEDDEISLDQIYEGILDRCWKRLIEDLDTTSVMDRIIGDGFFEKSLINDIGGEPKASEKIRMIIRGVKQKGEDGFKKFVRMVEKSGGTTLAKVLKREEKKALGKYQQEKEARAKPAEEKESPKESFEDIRKTAQFDGRIIKIRADWFEKSIELSEKIPKGDSGEVYTSGKYGDVFKYKEEKGRSLFIKKVSYENHDDVKNFALREISWGRLMHFAINPLLAMGEDTAKCIYYLVFPLMEKGVLVEAIAKDREKLDEGQDRKNLVLDQTRRLNIIYQIAAGLTYLHKGVTNFRSAVSHGNMYSVNMVLDSNYNVRIANFGDAKEENMETESCPENLKQDYKDFGNIILELCTSQRPKEYKKWLREQDAVFDDYKIPFMTVWKSAELRTEMEKLAKKCVEANITVKDIEEETVKKEIEVIHRTKLGSGDTWNVDKNEAVRFCDKCVINPGIEDDAVLKHKNQNCKVRLCVACLRNSYLNPIQCPECHKDIVSPIGQEWGAILIAGGDDDEELAGIFKKEMNKVYEKITSKYPLIMGISKELVHQVSPSEPTPKTPTEQLQSAFQDLQNQNSGGKEKLSSLLIYYTGHFCEDRGFLLDYDDAEDDEELYVVNELEQEIHKMQDSGCRKIIIFLDCCHGPQMKGLNTNPFIQINSSRSDQKSDAVECSLFTSYLLKGLSGKALEEKCLNEEELNLKDGCQICKTFNSNNGFISVEALSKYIDNHVHVYKKIKGIDRTEAVLNLEHVNWKDATIAYFIDKRLDYEFKLQHDGEKKDFQLHELPETIGSLKEKLLKAFIESRILKLQKFDPRDADILAIAASTGVENEHTGELMHMNQIAATWNKKCQLIVTLRPLDTLHSGKVGLIPDTGVTAQSVLEVLRQDCAKECCKIETVRSAKHVTVPLSEGGVATLYNCLQDNAQQKGKPLTYLCSCLRQVKNNEEIKKKQGELVMCFPHQTEGGDPQNFFSVQIKETKALSPSACSSGTTAVAPE